MCMYTYIGTVHGDLCVCTGGAFCTIWDRPFMHGISGMSCFSADLLGFSCMFRVVVRGILHTRILTPCRI